MSDYWDVNNAVISSLERSLGNKGNNELRKDYEELKNASYDYSFVNNYFTFSILPAFISLGVTVAIAMIKPEYIQFLVNQAGYQVDVNEKLVGGGLSIFNFILTLIGLTNIVSFQINKSISGTPKRKLQKRHIKNLGRNFDKHKNINMYYFLNKESSNPLIKAAIRNFKMEPVGTNILYPYIVEMHESEMAERNLSNYSPDF